MPAERISKEFKDISLSLKINPLNFDLVTIKNETAIARSIRNLIFTIPGEKFFNQSLGSNISRSLFGTIDNISASEIENEITTTIENYEPRAKLIGVDVAPDYENNEYNVTIRYYIIGIDALPQELSFALQSVR